MPPAPPGSGQEPPPGIPPPEGPAPGGEGELFKCLNEFALIRTTFETMEVFPDDPALRSALMEIVRDAREALVRRLQELADRVDPSETCFLGINLRSFRREFLRLVSRGLPRQALDRLLKGDVFQHGRGKPSASEDRLYRYQFRPSHAQGPECACRPGVFFRHVLQDLQEAATDEQNYHTHAIFDRQVFQKFAAVLYVCLAITEPVF
jgi:hypothetical protein